MFAIETFIFSLVLFTCFSPVEALQCLEGADCIRDASCQYCDGIACTRIESFSMEDNHKVALTCLPEPQGPPYAFRVHHLEEEGCRRVDDHEICICYSGDFCNSDPSIIISSLSILSVLSLLILL